uniref:Nephrocystin 3-like N-terminal domain-containing protein n=1 Tax=Moniliophthora roreri TaxID=221103 RepID=A0A0W0GAU3_MONRR
MFNNASHFNINNGQFTTISGDQINNYVVDPLQVIGQELKDVGASHDSEMRYPAPQCHPDTREKILGLLLDWTRGASHSDRIFWLYGPAGAGKSAISQTIAESCQKENILVSREAIRDHPGLLQAGLEDQFRELILEPCPRYLQRNLPHRVIIIDGLDECDGSHVQQRILSILVAALPLEIPLRFLVCSRPEPSIREVFNTDHFRPYLRRVVLDGTFNPSRDIQVFLVAKFRQIRNNPRNHHIHFPVLWPAPGIIDELVQKASGQFIYAATVIKFIDSDYSDPCEQLKIILCPGPYSDLGLGSPFHDPDVLYLQILSTNPLRSKVREVIRALSAIPYSLNRLHPTPQCIEALLILKEGEVISTLRGMHSILDISGPNDDIRNFHASFDDFLRDPTRSGYFFVGDDRTQHSSLACWYLHAIDHYFEVSQEDEKTSSVAHYDIYRTAWETWGSQCSASNLNDEVLNAVRNAKLAKTADPEAWLDVIQRFSDYRRGFHVKVSRPHVPDAALFQILDASATALGWLLIRSPLFLAWEYDVSPLRNFEETMKKAVQPKHFQVTSIGNDCVCTRAKDASYRLSLPCSKTTFDDVYHVQISVAMRNAACVGMYNDREWRHDPRTRCLTRSPVMGNPTYCLSTLLDICGPCPEFLGPLLPLFLRIVWNGSRRSFEMASVISPGIQLSDVSSH